MTLPRGLSGRLMLGLGLTVLISWLISAVISGVILRHELDEAFDSALQRTAERLMPLAIEEVALSGNFSSHQVPDLPGRDTFIAYQLRDATGKVLVNSSDAPPQGYAVPLARGFSDIDGIRVFTLDSPDGTLFLHIAEPLSHRRAAALEATMGLVQPLLVLLPLSLIGVWGVVRHGLAPVHALRDEIGRRDGGNLTPLPDSNLLSELAPITSAINRLLERLRLALTAERDFSANAAHELRTPLAGALAEAQLLASELGENPLRRRVTRIELSLKRVVRLSEKLLDLSRAEALVTPQPRSRDLMPALRLVLDEFRGTDFILTGAETFPAKMDLDSFAILLRNLISNATDHGTPDTPVEITLAPRLLRITNACPPVAPDTLAGLTERFRRGATSAPGSGIGLTIAQTIANRSEARLTLLSPAPGRTDGFTAEVMFAA